MARRLYETEEDRRAELEIAQQITAAAFPAVKVVRKQPRRYVIDFALFDERDHLVALAEIKDRGCSARQYPSCILSAYKVHWAQQWRDRLDLPVWFVVRWTDAVGMVRLDWPSPTWHIGWGGRTDRGDPEDQELVYFIPINEFRAP